MDDWNISCVRPPTPAPAVLIGCWKNVVFKQRQLRCLCLRAAYITMISLNGRHQWQRWTTYNSRETHNLHHHHPWQACKNRSNNKKRISQATILFLLWQPQWPPVYVYVLSLMHRRLYTRMERNLVDVCRLTAKLWPLFCLYLGYSLVAVSYEKERV